MCGVVLLFCGYEVTTGFLFLGSAKGFFEVGSKFFIFLFLYFFFLWVFVFGNSHDLTVEWLSNELLFHVSSLFLSLWLSSVHHFFQLLLEFSCSFELLFCNFRFCSIHLILSILAVNQIIVFQIHCSFFSFFLTSVHASPSAVDVIKYTIFMYKSCKHLDFMYFLTWDFQS